MKIHTIRRMEYKGTIIYVNQFAHVMQYMFSWKGEIYMQHIVATPNFIRNILFKMGVLETETPYKKDDLDEFEKLMLGSATASIDAMMDPKAAAREAQRIKDNLIPQNS